MTPSPGWTVREMAGGVDILDGTGEMVCLMNTGKIETDREAAGRIVAAVNAPPEAGYRALVLEIARENRPLSGGYRDKARALLMAQGTGEADDAA